MLELKLNSLESLLLPQHGLCVSVYIDLSATKVWTPAGALKLFKALRAAKRELVEVSGLAQALRIFRPMQFFKILKNSAFDANGLAIFVSSRISGYLPLSFSVEDRLVVSDTFHIKPIVQYLDPDETWFFMNAGRSALRLYQGKSSHLEKRRELSSYFERIELTDDTIVRKVKQWHKLYASEGKVPFILAAEPEISKRIENEIAANIITVDRTEDGNEGEQEALDLATAAKNSHLAKSFNEKLNCLRNAVASGEYTTDVNNIIRALKTGNVEILGFAKGSHCTGVINWEFGFAHFLADVRSVDCVYDDICEKALLNGVRVLPLEENEMPVDADMVAVIRSKHKSRGTVGLRRLDKLGHVKAV